LHVQQLSGHKIVESLQRYHVASLKQQKKMSEILSDANINLSSSCSSSSASSFNNPNNVKIIPEEIQNQLSEEWNPVLPHHMESSMITTTF
jgi:hypothetical protein